jgi:predicted DNA-binding transcriptional regulator AlpA
VTQTNNETHRLLRVRQIVKPDGMLPICRSTFYHLVAKGLISPGILLGPRTRVWKETEIKGLIERLEAEGARHG